MTPTRRRWFAFSMRTLFVISVAIALQIPAVEKIINGMTDAAVGSIVGLAAAVFP